MHPPLPPGPTAAAHLKLGNPVQARGAADKVRRGARSGAWAGRCRAFGQGGPAEGCRLAWPAELLPCAAGPAARPPPNRPPSLLAWPRRCLGATRPTSRRGTGGRRRGWILATSWKLSWTSRRGWPRCAAVCVCGGGGSSGAPGAPTRAPGMPPRRSVARPGLTAAAPSRLAAAQDPASADFKLLLKKYKVAAAAAGKQEAALFRCGGGGACLGWWCRGLPTFQRARAHPKPASTALQLPPYTPSSTAVA